MNFFPLQIRYTDTNTDEVVQTAADIDTSRPFIVTHLNWEDIKASDIPPRIYQEVLDNLTLEDIPQDVKEDIISNATHEELLATEQDFDLEQFVPVDSKRIHDGVFLPKAYTDGVYVWFKGVKEKAARKWLYYIGAENEAQIRWYDGENLIFEGIDESRLSRYLPDNKDE